MFAACFSHVFLSLFLSFYFSISVVVSHKVMCLWCDTLDCMIEIDATNNTIWWVHLANMTFFMLQSASFHTMISIISCGKMTHLANGFRTE